MSREERLAISISLGAWEEEGQREELFGTGSGQLVALAFLL
jgi:hypothetical protein